jgi:CheY-like chemotaxis protein
VRPWAILIDIVMPGLNGWDVLATLKSDPVTARIPVVMLSVLDEKQKALDWGAVTLLTKPLDGRKINEAFRAVREAAHASEGGVPGGMAAAG